MNITLLDGGMGQELVQRSGEKPTGLWATQILLDKPELVRGVHDDYFAAGADIATTNTYAILRDRLVTHGIEDQFVALHRAACEMACVARDTHGSGQVAGSLGPCGWSYRPDMAPPAEQAAEVYAEIARLHEPYVDLFICETMASVDQARGAVLGAQVSNKPVWLAISVADEDGTRLRSGEPVTDILPLVAELQPDALLLNCSIPEAVSQALPLLAGQGVPVGGYANGFTKITSTYTDPNSTVDALEKRTDLDPAAYADFADSWVEQGAGIIGGCCEVGPAHIAELARRLKS
ncbi:MAG: homocysteine S-methyltransferase family protein [Thiolinea sp.]